MVKLGRHVFIAIESDRYAETFIFGSVVAIGTVKDNPDAFWVEIEGLTSRFYSDKVRITEAKLTKNRK
jgi:hypothetical protein